MSSLGLQTTERYEISETSHRRITKTIKGLGRKVYEERLQKGDDLACNKNVNGDLILTFRVTNGFKDAD